MSDTDTLEALMSRDPHGCSDQDIDAVIAVFRARRGQFLAGNLKAGKVTAAKAPSGADKEIAEGILKDLGL